MSERLDNLAFIGKTDMTVAEALREVRRLETENEQLRIALRAIAGIMASGSETRVWRIATRALEGENVRTNAENEAGL